MIKQADVLMLHQMVPGEVAPGSLEANLDRYMPMTARVSQGRDCSSGPIDISYRRMVSAP